MITLPEVSALLSRVGRDCPALVQSRDGMLLIEAILAEARKLPKEPPPRAPCDVDPH